MGKEFVAILWFIYKKKKVITLIAAIFPEVNLYQILLRKFLADEQNLF
jgi:hypothetical protein